MLADPEVQVWTISRQIAAEIARLIGETADTGPFRRRTPLPEVNTRLRALRELQKTLIESETLAKRDVLDLWRAEV
jgi:hypothetical protein